MNLNKVFLVGNLTRDVDLRATPGGTPVATLGVATNRVWTDKSGNKQEEVEFHNVVLWGRQAELAKQYLTKGRMVMIEGRLRTRTWDDKATGQKRYRTEVIAERIQYGPRLSEVGPGPRQTSDNVTPQHEGVQPQPAETIDSIQLDEELGPAGTQTEISDVPF
jgi:single-strand DNA-binding protein